MERVRSIVMMLPVIKNEICLLGKAFNSSCLRIQGCKQPGKVGAKRRLQSMQQRGLTGFTDRHRGRPDVARAGPVDLALAVDA